MWVPPIRDPRLSDFMSGELSLSYTNDSMHALPRAWLEEFDMYAHFTRGNSNHQTTIDFEALASDLDFHLRRAEPEDQGVASATPEYKISMVKRHVRNVDSASGQYTPRSVMVGPYHHNPISPMEPVKRAALLAVLPGDDERRLSTLVHYLAVIASVVHQVRRNYADGANRWSDEELTHMLLLDGFYVLYSFGVGGFKKGSSSAGQAGGGMSAMDKIEHVRDVFYLLENQIPFLVLEKVYELFFPEAGAGGGSSTTKVIIDGFAAHLRPLLEDLGYSVLNITCPPCSQPWHLLHFLHMHFTPATVAQAQPPTTTPANDVSGSNNDTAAGEGLAHRWYGATQYHNAGVTFKRGRHLDGSKASSILDVKFDRFRLTLWIPKLTVDNNTWRILRNLMALEQQSPADVGTSVTAYCLFMSQLAGTARDVEFLARKGIIVHYMGSDEDVAKAFGDLCKGVALDLDGSNYLHETWERMDKRYNNKAINWMALLHRRHLSNPLVVVALVAAIVGFVCGLIQAIYAIKSYKHPN